MEAIMRSYILREQASSRGLLLYSSMQSQDRTWSMWLSNSKYFDFFMMSICYVTWYTSYQDATHSHLPLSCFVLRNLMVITRSWNPKFLFFLSMSTRFQDHPYHSCCQKYSLVQTRIFFVIESKETRVIYVMLMCMLGPFTIINIGAKVGIQKFKKMMNSPSVPCLQCRLLVPMEGTFDFKFKSVRMLLHIEFVRSSTNVKITHGKIGWGDLLLVIIERLL